MEPFYITTPIYYVNGDPHIGHAYTTVVADVMARYYRAAGRDVYFLTGTDEHGLKVQRAAEARGITPQALADEVSEKFERLFSHLGLTYDRFIRTTEPGHDSVVKTIVNRMKDNGDIYLGSYAGWYAASDEAFYDESEIEDGFALKSGAKVEWVEESSYFFKLSRYQQPLLDWYAADENHVAPDFARKEVTSFVSGGLRDLSISRTTFDWGIPFPDDPEHVLYVWVDALTNYITGVGAFTDQERYDRYWPCDCHLIGKDILRFHAVYWPAFLMSADLEPPKQVFAHGWWTNEGKKMSKSAGNVIDAFELADAFDQDVLRYFFLREIPLGSDGNFVRKRVAERNNSELADNYGNLVNRTLAMTKKYFDGQIQVVLESDEEVDVNLRNSAEEIRDAIALDFEERATHRALARVMELSSELNNYIHLTQPWKLAKSQETERLSQVLANALEGIRWVSLLAAAFLPNTAEKILGALKSGDTKLPTTWGGLVSGELGELDVLFAKIDLDQFEEEVTAEHVIEEPNANLVSFNDFMEIEIHVGLVKTAEPVDGADKLLKLSVSVSETDVRQVVAGVALAYQPEELVGRNVAVVTNLKPVKIFGIKSEAMLLAADTKDGGLELTFYSENVSVGTRVS